MPPELLLEVCTLLDSCALANLAACNRSIRESATQPHLWEALLRTELGFEVYESYTNVGDAAQSAKLPNYPLEARIKPHLLFGRAAGATLAADQFYAAFNTADAEAMQKLWCPDGAWVQSSEAWVHRQQPSTDALEWEPWKISLVRRMLSTIAGFQASDFATAVPFVRHPNGDVNTGHTSINASFSNIFRGAVARGTMYNIHPRNARGRISPCGNHAATFGYEVMFETLRRTQSLPAVNHFVRITPQSPRSRDRRSAPEWKMAVHITGVGHSGLP